jgi:hypothetical protein
MGPASGGPTLLPGRNKIRCTRSAARTYVKYVREGPASPGDFVATLNPPYIFFNQAET